jgi:phosphopantothenoylcysteine decarboxylase/phosphopantothenate--cysteine ligase
LRTSSREKLKRKKRSPLRNKSIIAGVTGSVAAYKAVELVRRLRDCEAEVEVIMTSASVNFITPLSLELASGKKTITGIFDDPLSHVQLPKRADLFIVAPATANIIGKFANGIADDILSATFLAYKGKTLIAPAMNTNMYEHPAVRRNLKILKEMGVIEIEPACGPLACGREGVGRMNDIEEIIQAAEALLAEKDLAGEKILITAGPTREYIDPVRFISNPSSGKMGYALAKAAIMRGAEVTLITGPSVIEPPKGLKDLIRVEKTEEMREAVLRIAPKSTILIMAAAPADFTPKEKAPFKVERKKGEIVLQLKATEDILAEVSHLKRKPFLIGFAAETGDNIVRARKKLKEKGLDMIVMNDVTSPGAGFEGDTNIITLIDKNGGEEKFPLMSKEECAGVVLDRVLVLKRI